MFVSYAADSNPLRHIRPSWASPAREGDVTDVWEWSIMFPRDEVTINPRPSADAVLTLLADFIDAEVTAQQITDILTVVDKISSVFLLQIYKNNFLKIIKQVKRSHSQIWTRKIAQQVGEILKKIRESPRGRISRRARAGRAIGRQKNIEKGEKLVKNDAKTDARQNTQESAAER